mgnify:CR=1 FL=1
MIYIFFIFINILILIFNKKINYYFDIYDEVNFERKIHKIRTPLTGGLIIFLNLVIIYIFEILYLFNYFPFKIIPFNLKTFLFFICFFLVGVYDDKYNLKANIKFLILILISYLLLLSNNEFLIREIIFTNYQIEIESDFIVYCFTIFCFLSIINSFNMFDGINLQLGLLSFFIIFILILLNPTNIFFHILLIALFNFILLNFNGKLFFGDSGSILIAAIIGVILINLHNSQLILSESILSLLFLPGIDMIRLFVIRIYKSRHPFSPDNNHIHHLILKHHGIMLTNILLLLFTIFSYLIFKLSPNIFVNILINTILYFTLIFYFSSKTKV